MLVTVFALGAYTRRRWPGTARWKPRPPESDEINRLGHAAAWIFYVCGTIALVNPGDVFPWLDYDPAFLGPRAVVVLALLVASLVLYAVVIAHGRWDRLTRRVAIGFDLVLAVALTLALATGRVFAEEMRVDEIKWYVLAGTLLIVAVDVTQKVRRERR
ncbi:hypothetical protein [Herbidospora cretacea]|uniref:hypothetical protein n=1 Tax=Herbidospora cretacea TaxID=28444 RepID=UPI000774B9A6|nr:hypothetical protein [Herbidospora cretacea]